MRTSLVLFAALLFPAFSVAQDDPAAQAMQAAQAAQDLAIQANQQAIADMQRAQEANDQMMREMQSADDDASTAPAVAVTAAPKISVKSAKYPGPVTIKLSDRSRGAVM